MISLAKQDGTDASSFGLLGTVSIRLQNHTAVDLRLVHEQLGMDVANPAAEPDLVLRFEDRVPQPSLHYVDDATAFSSDGFFLLRGRRQEKVCVRLPIEDIGTRCELVCQRGMSAIPLLAPIMKVTALSKAILPLHASSFVFRGQGAFVAGFAHSAKTTTLLGFMAHGAQCIGDDTAYLDHAGRLVGDKSSIGLSDRHLADLPKLRAALSYRQRLAIKTAGALTRSISAVAPSYEAGQSSLHRGLRKLDRVLSGRRSAEVSLEKLFPAESLCESHSLQRAFLSLVHDSPDIVIENTSRDAFIERLVHVILHEFEELTSLYEKFRFAFPSKRNTLLDGLSEKIEEVARERLASQAFYTVYHPYPVSPQSMFEALSPQF